MLLSRHREVGVAARSLLSLHAVVWPRLPATRRAGCSGNAVDGPRHYRWIYADFPGRTVHSGAVHEHQTCGLVAAAILAGVGLLHGVLELIWAHDAWRSIMLLAD